MLHVLKAILVFLIQQEKLSFYKPPKHSRVKTKIVSCEQSAKICGIIAAQKNR